MTLGWPELTALDAYRITEIPRRPGPGETGASAGLPNDPGRTQRLAALIAAYHAGVRAKDNDARTATSRTATRARWPWAGCGIGPAARFSSSRPAPAWSAARTTARSCSPCPAAPGLSRWPAAPWPPSWPSCRAGGPSAGSGWRPSGTPGSGPRRRWKSACWRCGPGRSAGCWWPSPWGAPRSARWLSRWPGRPSRCPARRTGSGCGTPNCARACRPGCGGSGWPRAAPTPMRRPGWPGWSARPPTWPNCPTRWPRPTPARATCPSLCRTPARRRPTGTPRRATPGTPAPSWSRCWPGRPSARSPGYGWRCPPTST